MSGLADVRRYDGAVVARGRRDELVPLAVQPRDLQVIDAVRRHKFLTAPQLLDLWWPGGAAQVGRRRLKVLFEAGLLDRFRPVAIRGSFPWTYQLGREGHRMLQDVGLIPRGKRFEVQEVYDYRYVLHEVHLNAWVIAWRQLVGDAMVSWDGETLIDPPSGLGKPPLQLDGGITAHGLKDTYAKPLRPDDVIEVVRDNGEIGIYFIEYDRTRRVDKNFEKFRRYDSFLCWWSHFSEYRSLPRPPVVVFVCQDDEHLELFLEAADGELTGYQVRAYKPSQDDYIGRRKIAFAVEADMHQGDPTAYRVPNYPPGHHQRDNVYDETRLPGFSVTGG